MDHVKHDTSFAAFLLPNRVWSDVPVSELVSKALRHFHSDPIAPDPFRSCQSGRLPRAREHPSCAGFGPPSPQLHCAVSDLGRSAGCDVDKVERCFVSGGGYRVLQHSRMRNHRRSPMELASEQGLVMNEPSRWLPLRSMPPHSRDRPGGGTPKRYRRADFASRTSPC